MQSMTEIEGVTVSADPLPVQPETPQRSTASHTVVVLQPGYLPWLGFFDQVRAADTFVYYDDVQFDKHGWRNRNRIKGPTGEPVWLTVPALLSGQSLPCIKEVRIDTRSRWARKHLASIQQYYARAPFLKHYLDELQETLLRPWELLVDLDLAVTALLCRWLKLPAPTVRSSDLSIEGERSERLVRICQHFGATRYVSGVAAQTYLDVGLFKRQGIEVCWQNFSHPVYPQLHGEFVPYLSALDLVLNCGEAGAEILAGGSVHAAAA